ncbi:hypothetical protein GOBAR_DD02563 [Gossypium barbadense]|nr:hypothetical protein GOBAR_DD02563 [Gossypium barbadense]
MWHGMVYPEGHAKCGWRWFIDGRFSVAAAHRPLTMAKWMPKDNGRSAVDCLTARSVWTRIVPLDDQARFFRTSVKDWVCENLANVDIGGDNCIRDRYRPTRVTKLAAWCPPQRGWIKLNTDGAVQE